MGGTKVTIDINDEKAFRGYVVGQLEKVDKLEEKVDKIEGSVMAPETCGINKIKKTLFGNGKEGLVVEVAKLKLSHKIKSGVYGLVGGMVVVFGSIATGVFLAYMKGLL